MKTANKTLVALLGAALLAAAVPVYGQQPAEGRSRKNNRQRILEMDVNKDGRISREEWKGKAKQFDRIDADRDSVLTQEELRNARGKKKRR